MLQSSKISVLTRAQGEDAGYHLSLEWGETTGSGVSGAAPGTTVEVADLFGNQPARRKFLRSTQAETSRVQELVSRYSLAFPEVRFRLVNDGRESLSTPGNGQPRESLLAVYGSQVASGMLEVYTEDQEAGYAVEGFTGAPSISRANRTYLTFFVNRRLIQSRMLSFAVEDAYAGLLQVKRYPVAAVNVVLPYSEVDVNSHPAKREVRFHQESKVFSLVQRAVRAAIVSDSPVPAATPSTGDFAPFRSFGRRGGAQPGQGAVFPGRAGESPVSSQAAAATGEEALALFRRPAVPLKVVGQLKLTYVVAEGPEGMYLVDQHAAHERVVFDRICSRRDEEEAAAQPLLVPVNVELTPTHATTLMDNLDSLRSYGFELEPFGERSYLLRTVPSVLATDDAAKSLIDILDLATLEGTGQAQGRHHGRIHRVPLRHSGRTVPRRVGDAGPS